MEWARQKPGNNATEHTHHEESNVKSVPPRNRPELTPVVFAICQRRSVAHARSRLTVRRSDPRHWSSQ